MIDFDVFLFHRWLGVTQFEATDARSSFPCFDEPQMKANFSLSIVREKNYTTLFNTPKKSTYPLKTGNELVVDEYPYTVKMSTYLVAFLVSDFTNITTVSDKFTQVNSFHFHKHLKLFLINLPW